MVVGRQCIWIEMIDDRPWAEAAICSGEFGYVCSSQKQPVNKTKEIWKKTVSARVNALSVIGIGVLRQRRR